MQEVEPEEKRVSGLEKTRVSGQLTLDHHHVDVNGADLGLC